MADLKTMDGGYLEAEMMAKAGANLVVVMGRAHEATIRRVVDAGREFGIKVMGDNLAADDRVACARWMEGLGVDFIVHHIGFDERAMVKGLSPMDELDEVVARRVDPGAGGGRAVDSAGDRMPAPRGAAGRARRAAGDRRQRVPPRRCRSVHDPAPDLSGHPECLVTAAIVAGVREASEPMRITVPIATLGRRVTDRFSGLFAAIVTPIDDNGAVDLDTLDRVVDHALVPGVAGICVGGATGRSRISRSRIASG